MRRKETCPLPAVLSSLVQAVVRSSCCSCASRGSALRADGIVFEGEISAPEPADTAPWRPAFIGGSRVGHMVPKLLFCMALVQRFRGTPWPQKQTLKVKMAVPPGLPEKSRTCVVSSRVGGGRSTSPDVTTSGRGAGGPRSASGSPPRKPAGNWRPSAVSHSTRRAAPVDDAGWKPQKWQFNDNNVFKGADLPGGAGCQRASVRRSICRVSTSREISPRCVARSSPSAPMKSVTGRPTVP